MIGENLGHFRILEMMGEGGMGRVYRALDTKLGREVAIKVLPQAVAADQERLARLEQEARVLASMNHPQIAAIYDLKAEDQIRYLVMELVLGDDLKQRCRTGALPVSEALRIAEQMATGLEAAHAQGIIHRDLKPDNVKVTPNGSVKVLDFGLAKQLLPAVDEVSTSISPTITPDRTRAGEILGTAPYMSPEQARGQPVDHRADIWAFGCTLFEMLTGKGPFRGQTVMDCLAAVLEREPDWSLLPAETPPRIRELLGRCLDKDLDARLPEIGLARREVAAARSGMKAGAGTASVGASRLWRTVAWGAVVLAVAAIAGYLVLSPDHRTRAVRSSGSVTRLVVGLSSTEALEQSIVEHQLANGLKILILERHEVPVFTGIVHVDAGSAADPSGGTGTAHLIEHMGFKGSSRFGTTDFAAEQTTLAKVDEAHAALVKERRKGAGADPGVVAFLEETFRQTQEEAARFSASNELGEAYQRNGGQNLNAQTRHDVTQYYVSLPSNKLELWFNLESERFRDPVFREFYKEVEVVKEERRGLVESNPIGKLVEEFMPVAFQAHPYRNPGLGWPSDLENITRQRALEFFKRYYVPQNMTLVLVGDVYPDEVIELAERYFGSLPGGEIPEPPWTEEPSQRSERRIVVPSQSQPVLIAGYHRPDGRHPDDVVFEVIVDLLITGRTSRLHRRLIDQDRLAVQVIGRAQYPDLRHPTLLVLVAGSAPGHSNAEIEPGLFEEISRLAAEQVAHEELRRLKRQAKARLLNQIDTNQGMAMMLAHYQGVTGDWRTLFQRIDAIGAVTRADIQRVAETYLTETNRTVGFLEPEGVSAGG